MYRPLTPTRNLGCGEAAVKYPPAGHRGGARWGRTDSTTAETLGTGRPAAQG